MLLYMNEFVITRRRDPCLTFQMKKLIGLQVRIVLTLFNPKIPFVQVARQETLSSSAIKAEENFLPINYGKLDITFYRDDIRKEIHVPNQTDIKFSIEDKNVVLIDDVLYTGRTIRAALDALMDFGRPAKVELMVLIDRRYSRQLPIQPDYTGKSIDSIITQRVKVLWKEKDEKDEVVIFC